jgi:hypothetical protein
VDSRKLNGSGKVLISARKQSAATAVAQSTTLVLVRTSQRTLGVSVLKTETWIQALTQIWKTT